MQTIAGRLWPRPSGARRFPVEKKLYRTQPDVQVLVEAQRPAGAPRGEIVLVHGLEGSSESGYMLGIAEKAFRAGFSVIRMNQRNCGGTEKLTPTLYNSSLSGDYAAILRELIERDGFREVFFCGYSMGGNLVMKMASELGDSAPPQLRAVAVVCPALDLSAGADALAEPRNFLYERRFVNGLKARARRKASLFPDEIRLDGIEKVRTIREFDDFITAPNCGFRDAADYYHRASALRSIANVGVPALMLAAKDDPIVPYASLCVPAVQQNPHITLELTDHGGHCAYISRWPGEQRFWSEARMVEFFRTHSSLYAAGQIDSASAAQ